MHGIVWVKSCPARRPPNALRLPSMNGSQPDDPCLLSTDNEAVTGSHFGSHRRERLPAPGERLRAGGWRSCQLADRSGRR
jgi:hypothetical protein